MDTLKASPPTVVHMTPAPVHAMGFSKEDADEFKSEVVSSIAQKFEALIAA